MSDCAQLCRAGRTPNGYDFDWIGRPNAQFLGVTANVPTFYFWTVVRFLCAPKNARLNTDYTRFFRMQEKGDAMRSYEWPSVWVFLGLICPVWTIAAHHPR